MIPEHRKNLENLIQILEDIHNEEKYPVPGGKFHMLDWYVERDFCGTTACALGMTVVSELFPNVTHAKNTSYVFCWKNYKISVGDLSKMLFGMDRYTTMQIFFGKFFEGKKDLGDVRPIEVAVLLRRFVNSEGNSFDDSIGTE